MRPNGLLWAMLLLARPVIAVPVPAESLGIKVWEASFHSTPEVAHRGEPFELHVHVIWGSHGGREAVVPLWKDMPGIEFRKFASTVQSQRNQPGGAYAVHAELRYILVPLREGVLPMDSLSFGLSRDSLGTIVAMPHTAIQVLPPVSRMPRPWVWGALAAGLVTLISGLWTRSRRRPRKVMAPALSAEDRAVTRWTEFAGMPPTREAAGMLLEFLRAGSAERMGGTWALAGRAAAAAWGAGRGETATMLAGLAVEIEERLYAPGDPGAESWNAWLERLGHLWGLPVGPKP